MFFIKCCVTKTSLLEGHETLHGKKRAVIDFNLNVFHLCVPDNIICPERCYPAGHHTHSGQFKSETRKRCASAGL